MANALAGGAGFNDGNARLNDNLNAIPVAPRGRFWQAFGAALTIEALLVGALLAWIGMSPPKPAEPVIPLTIEALVPPEPLKPPDPVVAPAPDKQKPPPPAPVAKAVPRAAPPPPAQTPVAPKVPMPAAPETAAPQPPVPFARESVTTPMVATPPTVAPAPASVPATVPAPPAVPAPGADPSPAYNARLTAAAQAAFEVPGSVASLNFKGRTRVGFKLRDGEASGVTVVQPSGLGAMDRAAVKAVQTARFPLPPDALQGKEVAYEIWVTHATAN